MDSRTTTDAVHVRLQSVNFYCETCRTEFKAKEIEQHFSSARPHQPKGKCIYCEGPYYSYIDSSKAPCVWHRCPRS